MWNLRFHELPMKTAFSTEMRLLLPYVTVMYHKGVSKTFIKYCTYYQRKEKTSQQISFVYDC
jgi:hypothetical protein